MTDEHHRGLARGNGRQHRVQIGAEPVNGDVIPVGPAGPAVTALVPEHQPAQGGKIPALVVPAVLVQRVAVAEDDRDRRIIAAVDLRMQGHAVAGEHGERRAAQFAERLSRLRVRPQPLPADRYLLGRDDGARPCYHRADDQACRAGNPPPTGHLTSRYVLAPRDAASSGGSVTPE